MDVKEMNREELWASAKKLELSPAKNIGLEDLRTKVEFAEIERREKVIAGVREDFANKAKLKQRIAEVKASADLAKITITIPDNANIMDVVRIEKELGIKKKIPKPSPETLAIEKSKKVYAIFRNIEQEDVDIFGAAPGGKYKFNFWHDKVHVLPEWLINYYRSRKNPAGTRPLSEYTEIHGNKDVVAQMTRTERKPRFAFEIIGDAPKNAEFGVVTNEATLSKLEQHV